MKGGFYLLSTDHKTFRCATAELDSPVPIEHPIMEDGKLKVRCTGCDTGCILDAYGLVSEKTYLQLLAEVENK